MPALKRMAPRFALARGGGGALATTEAPPEDATAADRPEPPANTTYNMWVHDDRFSRLEMVLNPDVFAHLRPGDIVEIARAGECDEAALANAPRSGSFFGPGGAGIGSAGAAGAKAANDAPKTGVLEGLRAERLTIQVPPTDNGGAAARQPNLQLSIASHVAAAFDLPARGSVTVRRVDPRLIEADYIELSIRDQYIGRSDMWRLTLSLVGCCVYTGKRLAFPNWMRAVCKEISVGGRPSSCGLVTDATRIVFRSESAKCFIFVQMSREMNEFSEDGELHMEKVVHGVLPELFGIWHSIGVTHVVTICLFARVFFPSLSGGSGNHGLGNGGGKADSKAQGASHKINAPLPGIWTGAADELNEDAQGRKFQDFYRVVVDWETRGDWSTVLVPLKRELVAFQKDVLCRLDPAGRSVLCGQLAAASEGNLLEAVNLALNPFDKHYVDRDFSRTGLSIVVVTAGPGRFLVDENLWRLTTERMTDNGIGLDLVCLCRPPLYQVPVFEFESASATGYALGELTAELPSSAPVQASVESPTRAASFSPMTLTAAAASPGRSPAMGHVTLGSNGKSPAAFSGASAGRAGVVAEGAGLLSPPAKASPANRAPGRRTMCFSLPNWSACSFWTHKEELLAPGALAGVPGRRLPFLPRAIMPEVQQMGSLELSDAFFLDGTLSTAELAAALDHSGRLRPATSTAAPVAPPVPAIVGSAPSAATSFNGMLASPATPASTTLTAFVPASQLPAMRTRLVNPCQPAKTALQSSSGYKRWLHIFGKSMAPEMPFAVMNWKAITTPATLPLTTEFFPSAEQLSHLYQEYTYTVSPNEEANAYQDTTTTNESARIESLLTELIAQRLAQGFQLVVGPLLGTSGGGKDATVAMALATASSPPEPSVEPGQRAPAKPGSSTRFSIRRPYFLSMGDHVHKLFYDASGQNIEVKRYVRRTAYSRSPMQYRCCLWPKSVPGGYQRRQVQFSYPSFGTYNWNYLDHLVSGYQEDMPESLRFWRTRFVLIPTDALPAHNYLAAPSPQRNETLDDEELRVAGFRKFLDAFERARWIPPDELQRQRAGPQARKAAETRSANALGIAITTLTPSQFVRAEMAEAAQRPASGPDALPSNVLTCATPRARIVAAALDPAMGFPVRRRRWHDRLFERAFVGSEAVDWFLRVFSDVDSREQAVALGNALLQDGVFEHVFHKHSFMDGYYFYRVNGEVDGPAVEGAALVAGSPPLLAAEPASSTSEPRPGPWVQRGSASNRATQPGRIQTAQRMVIDMDPAQETSQREKVVLHYDTVYNPRHCFHFQLHWLVCSARLIEDTLQSWSRLAEKCGLRLVEAPVEQARAVSDDHPFQSIVPVALALAPPPVQPARLDPNGPLPPLRDDHYAVEWALANGFVLDVEADGAFEGLPVQASYAPPPFMYTQLVHKTGVAFVHVLPRGEGYLWVNNRLVLTGAAGVALGASAAVSAAAAAVRSPSARPGVPHASALLGKADSPPPVDASPVLLGAPPQPVLASTSQTLPRPSLTASLHISSPPLAASTSTGALPPPASLQSSTLQHPDVLRALFQEACSDEARLGQFYDQLVL